MRNSDDIHNKKKDFHELFANVAATGCSLQICHIAASCGMKCNLNLVLEMIDRLNEKGCVSQPIAMRVWMVMRWRCGGGVFPVCVWCMVVLAVYTMAMANLFLVCFWFFTFAVAISPQSSTRMWTKKSMTHPLWCLFTGEHWSGALNPLPLEGEPAHPANVQLGSVSNYLCCFMLTCAYSDDLS